MKLKVGTSVTKDTRTIDVTLVPPRRWGRQVRGGEGIESALVNAITAIRMVASQAAVDEVPGFSPKSLSTFPSPSRRPGLSRSETMGAIRRANAYSSPAARTTTVTVQPKPEGERDPGLTFPNQLLLDAPGPRNSSLVWTSQKRTICAEPRCQIQQLPTAHNRQGGCGYCFPVPALLPQFCGGSGVGSGAWGPA
jgi:hypothetical protein